jgi:hypothetical protein
MTPEMVMLNCWDSLLLGLPVYHVEKNTMVIWIPGKTHLKST